jgi:hypothetical protein
MLQCFITPSGWRLIEVLREIAPNRDLDLLLVNALKALIHLAVSRKPNIPPSHDFLFLSSRSPAEFQGRFLTTMIEKGCIAEFEIPMPKDFFEGLTMLRELVTYESEDSAIRHVFLFAYYSEQEKRGVGYVH